MNPPDQNASEQWPQIEFVDDHEGCLFTATVTRKPVEELDLVETGPDMGSLKGHLGHLSGQSDPTNDLLNAIREAPSADYSTLAQVLRVSEETVKRNIQKLKRQNRIRRVGSEKTGYWEVIG